MEFFARLKGAFPRLYLEEGFDFARHTTIGCGGKALAAASPACEEETEALLAWLMREKIAFFLLGAGANVLPPDGTFEGVVVRSDRLKGLEARGTDIFAGAGVTGGSLLSFAEKRGIGGFSPLSGIPMTVGGATAMNAGVREFHLSDAVVRVRCVEGGRSRTLEWRDCAFGEKDSLFLTGVAVVGVQLHGRYARPSDIARESCYFRTRRACLPKGRSMGCVFVNPPQCPAGELIERCGLKGARRGGAFVSPKHANFIINEGGTAGDVAALIQTIEEEVLRRTGIALREEIRRIG